MMDRVVTDRVVTDRAVMDPVTIDQRWVNSGPGRTGVPSAGNGGSARPPNEPGMIDVPQTLPDRHVLVDATERTTVHEVGDLVHRYAPDRAA